MRNTDRNAKDRKPRRRIPKFYVNLAVIAALLITCLILKFVADERYEQKVRYEEAVHAKQRMARQRLEDSLHEALRRRIDSLKAHPITPEQRRRREELLRRQIENAPDPEALREKYNRGEELTPEEQDIIHDYFYPEYYEDPDAEDEYPSEIFDDREDYDEEHVRDNPGIAGED